MTRRWRWTMAALLCGLWVGLSPVPSASAAPAPDAGVGRVVADLGTVLSSTDQPGFSDDGAYYAYLSPAGGRCDLRLYDVSRRRPVALAHARVLCDGSLVHWAGHADTLQWQVDAAAGEVTAYAWDADPGQVSVLAPDAHVLATSGVSADGRFLAFVGRSDTHPAPDVDAPRNAGYVYDRTAGVSVPLSEPDVHVHFVSWSPAGANFLADTPGRTSDDPTTGTCFGSGTSCRVYPDLYAGSGAVWSRDGTAVIIGPGSTAGTTVYDFGDRRLTSVTDRLGFDDFAQFIGADAQRLVVNLSFGKAAVWDRKTDRVTEVFAHGTTYASPPGRYLLFRGAVPETWRYLDLSGGAESAATYRGTDGYWIADGSSFLGLGPASAPNSPGCSSLRQWSPATNTVSLFGPPGAGYCYSLPSPLGSAPSSSASGRFAVVAKLRKDGKGQEYVVDLRRHVLIGPLVGDAGLFAPAGSDVLAVRQLLGGGTNRLVLVDPTPVPDVDDKPRWSATTPSTGSRVEVGVGGQVQVQLGASDLQQTPVNLYFRWRTTANVPVASAPKGWSCDRRRLAAGATVADCTFAPPKDHSDVRFLDVWAVNHVTGAQSDTRSYRVATR